ncbi:SDR family NAD(P)-dependent oxidoreductase [Rhodococcus sp. P1Y]|uniref:SDR family NAD(P)-dependent oxidoreductase n=1 Tax=Rhodococcus sp. P1Y TaxID=1302308 RepID=UPI000EB38E4C|nr:SDR family NAD(P)-dependent oxidoreductase [Rhodococcus sp. P1Y]AYJ51907.1 SDR family NAD(P)-dependent oxidoreductase [Rhodococcus sp. P1Y]
MNTSSAHTIVMTGASQGIGAVAASRLLEDDPDAHLVFVGRRPGPVSPRVTFIDTDLADIAATRRAGRQICALLQDGVLPILDRFVGNAGIQHTDALTSTADGLEATFAVNVVANSLLLTHLQSQLAPSSRIVITVSDTHFGDLLHNLALVPAPVWSTPEVLARPGAFAEPDSARAGRTAYSTSKLAAIYLVHAWARALPPGVDIVSFNPGLVPGTGLTRHAGRGVQLAMRALGPVLALTPLATTSAQAGAALADLVLGVVSTSTGDYVDRRRVVSSSRQSYDSVRESELIEFLNTL